MRNLKISCQGEVCKIDKPPCFSIKTLKIFPPKKMENGIVFFFKFGILATKIDQSQILKNICQQLLWLNNVFKGGFPPAVGIKVCQK